MEAVSKLVIGIAGIIFSIVVIVTVIPAQIQQQQTTSSLIAQDKSQLSDASMNLINTCGTDQSVGDLTECKAGITDLKNKCQDTQYSSMPVCSDPRIDQFLSTVDSKITFAQTQIASAGSNLNNATLNAINLCGQVADPNSLSTCKTEMLQIQEECSSMGTSLSLPACNDPRIVQILNEQINQPSNVYDVASQSMESFINGCMIAQDNSTIQDCSTKARQMISLCQSETNVQACSDTRLQQIANMDQTLTTTSSTNSQTIVNATALNNINNQMQNILNECTSSTTSSSDTCVNAINTIKQDCSNTLERTYSSYFPVCYDPRLQ
ncbi:MAG: hypothetical protein ACREA3_02510 [Nitrosotalea sp.]